MLRHRRSILARPLRFSEKVFGGLLMADEGYIAGIWEQKDKEAVKGGCTSRGVDVLCVLSTLQFDSSHRFLLGIVAKIIWCSHKTSRSIDWT